MAATAQLDFRIAGAEEVRRVFRSIAQDAQDAAKRVAAADAGSTKERVRNRKAVADAEKQAAKDADAFQRAHDAADRARFRARVAEQDALRKAMNDADRARFKARVAEQIAAEKAAAKASADAQKMAAKEGAAAAKAAAQQARQLAKEAAQQRSAEDALQRQRSRALIKERIDAAREEARETRKIQAAATSAAVAENRTRRGVAGDIGAGAGRGFRSGVGTIASLGQLAVGGLGIATVANAVTSQLDLTKRAALLENASGRTGVDGQDFVRFAKGVSRDVGAGVSASDVMGGLEKISGKAGAAGIDQIAGKFKDLAKVAAGAGVSITDLGDVVGALVNRGVKADEMVTIVEKLVKQGKDGAVEFRDLATHLDASSGALLSFQMSATKRIETAGGLSQVARTFGRSSAAEATTSVVDLDRDITAKADLIKGLTGGKVSGTRMVAGHKRNVFTGGVEVGTDATRSQFRDVNELLPEIIAGAIKAGNVDKLIGEGGVFTGNSAFVARPLIQAATHGITKNETGRYELTTEGGRADIKGAEAVKALLAQFTNVQVGATDSADAHARVAATTRFSDALNRLSSDLGDRLAPKVAELTPTIIQVGQKFGELVGAIADHPYQMAAKFIALKTALGVAEAGLGSFAGYLGGKVLDALIPKATGTMTVTAAVVNVAGGGKVPVPTPPPGSPLAVGGGALAGVAYVAAGSYGTYKALGEEVGGRRSRADEAHALATAIRSGTATPEQVQRAKTLRGELETDQNAGAAERFIRGAVAPFQGLARGEFTAGNIAGALPVFGPLAAGGRAAMGSTEQGEFSHGGMGLKDLAAALDRPTILAPGTTISINNAEEIGAAVAAQMTQQGPKMPSVGGP